MKKTAFLTLAALTLSLSLNAFTLGNLGNFKFEKANENASNFLEKFTFRSFRGLPRTLVLAI
jgi:hypothetical protein